MGKQCAQLEKQETHVHNDGQDVVVDADGRNFGVALHVVAVNNIYMRVHRWDAPGGRELDDILHNFHQMLMGCWDVPLPDDLLKHEYSPNHTQ